MFEGNTDSNSIHSNKLNINAKKVRIMPINDPSMGDPKVALRVEFYVCAPCEPFSTTTPQPPTTTPKPLTTTPQPPTTTPMPPTPTPQPPTTTPEPPTTTPKPPTTTPKPPTTTPQPPTSICKRFCSEKK